MNIATIFVTVALEFASFEGAKVAYTDEGRGEPAFVLVHGWNGSAEQWRPVASRLAMKARVISIDLPGHGRSPWPPATRFTQELFAKAVEAVLASADVGRAVLVGHSMGAPLVREMEHLYPRRVAGLVLVDGTFWQSAPEQAYAANMAPAAEIAGPAYRQVAGRMIDSMFTRQTPPALRTTLKETMLRTPAAVAASSLLELARSRVWLREPSRVPALAVMTEATWEGFARRQFPRLWRWEVWSGAGHFLQLEQPERFARLLEEFRTTACRESLR